MARLLTSSAWTEITAAAQRAKSPGYAACAYFSDVGDVLLPMPASSLLVVDASEENVKSGIVSPRSLIRMKKKGIAVYSAVNLHAKTYNFGRDTFVGSCNASRMSSEFLIESCIWDKSPKLAADARDFVLSLAVNELTDAKLAELLKLYKPKKLENPASALAGRTLVLELLQEQGGTRASQVQPPKAVWERYFQIPWLSGKHHEVRLTNMRTGAVVTRPVVVHDHNMTLEFSDAQLPRPAILLLKRTGSTDFSFRVFRPNDRLFHVYEELLRSIKNPLRSGTRRWFAV